MGEPHVESTSVPTGEPVGSPVADATSQELESLRAFKASYDTSIAPFIEKVTPFYDDVNTFIDDETKRTTAQKSWRYLDDASREQEPEAVKQIRPFLDPVIADVKDIKALADEMRQERQMATYAQRVAAIASEAGIPQETLPTLVPQLIERGKSIGLQTVDQFMSYVKDIAPSLGAASKAAMETPKPKAPPKTTLRGDVSTPGLADTPVKVPMNRKDMGKLIRQRIGA